MAVKVILFDLDNTLIDRQKAFEEMLRERLSIYHENKDELEDVIKDIMIWDNHGNLDRLKVFEKYVEKYKIKESAYELNNYWKEHSGDIVYPFEDAIEVLDYLKRKYRLGIVSNGNAISQRRKMNKLSFLDIFEYTIVSGETDYNKPDIRLFNRVCEDLRVSASECVFIGDNYRCDIEGSYHAGMTPIWFVPNGSFETKLCKTIKSLSQLKELL